MSFDFPARLEREIENFATAQNISPGEAAVSLLEEALESRRSKEREQIITEAEWERLRSIPVFEFLEKLPDAVLESIEAASKRTRSERPSHRG